MSFIKVWGSTTMGTSTKGFGSWIVLGIISSHKDCHFKFHIWTQDTKDIRSQSEGSPSL